VTQRWFKNLKWAVKVASSPGTRESIPHSNLLLSKGGDKEGIMDCA
jgi:hypothetical protein